MESYAAGEQAPALIDQTIGQSFEATVAAHADREALVEFVSGRRWTWAELDADVDALARGLLGAGIAQGDRVGVWAPNCAEWTIAQYATAKVGAILVNVNPAYRTHEMSYAVSQSGMRLLLSAESFKTSDYRGMLEELVAQGRVDGLERVVYLGTEDWSALLAEGEGLPEGAVAERMAALSPSDPINIQYTSGTTGYPKGATLSHTNILNNGFFTTELIGFTEQDRLCIPVPFYHCFGMVMGNLGCTAHGATMVIPAPGFDPEATLRCVAQERCTALYGVPTMFIAMQHHPSFADHDLSSLRTGVMAGSICPVEVMKRCVTDMHMSEVAIAYGMTETSPVSCQTRTDDDLERRTATIGRVHPHVEIKVVDPATGETVPRGTTGEFCTRGYSVMLGYWDDPDKTREAIDSDGWMHTGDLAEMREDGYCNIVGRIKDMVIRGGENIYPREIEEFLYTHPDVEDVQVIGVPDEKYGEELAAWVTLREGADRLDADGVRAFATGKLAHYKIPRYVMVVEEFPMTVTGKIRKVQMREETTQRLRLERLAEEYWQHHLDTSPSHAHLLGHYERAGHFEDASREAEDRYVARLLELADAAEALTPDALGESGRLTRTVLIDDARARAAVARTRLTEIPADPVFGVQVTLGILAPMLALPTAEVADAMVGKLHGAGRWFRDAADRMREGAAHGRFPATFAVTDTIAQLEALLATPVADDPVLHTSAPPAGLDVDAWKARLREAVSEELRPGMTEYRDVLREVLPQARSDERVGLAHLPGGEAAYPALLRYFTTTDKSAQEIHEIGLAQVAALAEGYRELGPEVVGTDDLEQVFAAMRTDPKLHAESGEQLVEAAEIAMRRAWDAMGDWFEVLPQAPCSVSSTMSGAKAFYFPPSGDGSRGGTFFVNVEDPGSWGTFELEAMAFHEGIPGHHLQLAIASELPEVPAFRKHLHNAAYAEGWGLYSERLADEMGLYSGSVDRLGMYAADSMRACRLVVDTGMHALGWGREQAVRYMMENSPLTEGVVRPEIDRYAVTPGQACSYMVGRLEIQRMRREAEQRQGTDFSVAAFHSAVLDSGSLPLGVLDEVVRARLR